MVVSEEVKLLKTLVSDLEKELKTKVNENSLLEAEVRSLQRKLIKRDGQILKQERELHKLRSVLQQASSFLGSDKNGTLITDQDSHSVAGQVALYKKQGVSGQSVSTSHKVSFEKVDKDFHSRTLIKDAIQDNDFLKNLTPSQMQDLTDAMHEKKIPKGCYVIREGESGSYLYVAAEGEFEVVKAGKNLGRLGVGKVFGELAILYNCKRTASIRALVDGRVWALERKVFQHIMVTTGIQKIENQVKFLKSVPLLSELPHTVLTKLGDVLETEIFCDGDYIIREGTAGDTFYILAAGEVRVTRGQGGTIRELTIGDYFGEQALLKTDVRTANVIAQSAVECLTLDRESFFQLVGDIDELRDKVYDDVRPKGKSSRDFIPTAAEEYQDIELSELQVIATLGVGGFGRVELVKNKRYPINTFALKCMKKQHIVETHQQDHVFSERDIMMACRNMFITRLFKTFKDRKYVYMLMEASLGGEVWTILRDKGMFDEVTTRFYLASVVYALEYLHKKGIVYRDLKPENLLLGVDGYVKLVDFGFSKKLELGNKTWTFCGTPEYVAPEIILNKGHDKAVDFWSLGCLMYELLTGTPPFSASDPMKVYNIILRGFDQISMPRHISKNAVLIMKRFCRENPAERLGYQKDGIMDIKKHKWFQGFDWEGLLDKTLSPPLVPNVQNVQDVSNFDQFPRDIGVPADETSGWDQDF